MEDLNPVNLITSVIVKGVVLGIIISIAVPVSRLIASTEYKGYKKIKGLIKKPERTIVPDSLGRMYD